MTEKLDLIGEKFGRLTVLNKTNPPNNKNRKSYWLCICDCQVGVIKPKYRKVNQYSLISGNTMSCGCIQRERLAERNRNQKKFNDYNLSGEYGIGYTKKGEEFYFDLEDYEIIKSYVWRMNHRGYFVAFDDNQKHVSIHRLIMNPECEYDVDHINGENTRYDNRKYNLRICTRSQNMQNKNLRSDNTSGVTGVSWNNYTGSWNAYISIDGKTINLGYYDNKDDAIWIRKEAEEEYFGEFAYDKTVTYNKNIKL